MHITHKGDYALKAVLYLSLHYNKDSVVTIHELAQELDIPVKFLEQVLLELKKGGFLESKRGVKGGYHLSRPPKEIRVGDVVRFIDGPVEPIACANTKAAYKGCADIYKCVFRDIWVKVYESVSHIIDGVSFEDICNKVKKFDKTISYQI